MKRFIYYSFFNLLAVIPLCAQQGVTPCGTPTGQPPFPLGAYAELADATIPSAEDWAIVKGTHVS